jgi:hypothetical protein
MHISMQSRLLSEKFMLYFFARIFFSEGVAAAGRQGKILSLQSLEKVKPLFIHMYLRIYSHHKRIRHVF